MSAATLQVSRRQRATPYTARVQALGVSGFSVVNHTILPKGFQRSVDEDYWHLREHVQLWDVGCERQVELRGPDAARLAQLMTPRNLSGATVGQCLYAPMIDRNAGMLNDPVILKLAEDHFWFSIADSDMLLWADGLAQGMALDVQVREPDVWPMAIQGPKAEDLVASVFGEHVREIGFFRFAHIEHQGHRHVIARSGFSRQGGFEIYVDGFDRGEALWDAVWSAGKAFNLSPGCPHLVERIEGGLLSYGNEMTRKDNPLECGLGHYCCLDGSVEYVGRDALEAAAAEGPRRLIRGLMFSGDRCPPPQQPWALKSDDMAAGWVTSAAWSPRFNCNVALAMVEIPFLSDGTPLSFNIAGAGAHHGVVVDLPMPDTHGNHLDALLREG